MNTTKDKIISAAIDLFSTIPYGDVSILQITKQAGVSNGVIYTYFKNKEELFSSLMITIIERLEKKLKIIEGHTLEERLKNYISLNIQFTQEETKLIKIFRDGQYRFPQYEKSIKKVYTKALEKVFERKMDSCELMYILSAIRFINISFYCRNLSYNPELLVKMLLNGFLEPCDISLEKIYSMDLYERSFINSHNPRHQLLNKGEQLFGEKEYHDVKIKDITKKIDISVGSFYSFFETKEKFLIEIAEKLKKEMLFLIQDNYNKELPKTEMYVILLYIFMEYFQKAKYKYKLIRDVEFLNFDIYIDFLNKSEACCIDILDNIKLSEEEKRLAANIFLGIKHYIGIEIFFSSKTNSSEKCLKDISNLFIYGVRKKHI